VTRFLAGCLRLYQKFVSPVLPPSCRFHPTCSEYMRQAIQKKGVVKGILLGLRRLACCHPWHAGGFDPLP
jgi:putative membrane protein insertion efficiency factor